MSFFSHLILLGLLLAPFSAYLFRSPPSRSPSNSDKIQLNSSATKIDGIQNGYSGYLNVNKSKSSSSLYYIFYSSQKQSNSSAPIIVWMNGGPGASSLLGAFYENGPYTLVRDQVTALIYEAEREINWAQNYNVLYLDQPIGTGLSYLENDSEIPTNQEQVAEHLYNALQEFFTLDPFKSFINNKLIIAGESYGGKYAPAIAVKIIDMNKNLDNSSAPNPQKFQKINLKGVSIGDGFTDPLTIMSEVGMFCYNLGLIDYTERQTIEMAVLKGLYFAKSGQWTDVQTVFNSDVFDRLSSFTDDVNVYNIQLYGDYDNSELAYFNDTLTQKRYNILPGTQYFMESSKVYKAMASDFMQNVAYKVDYLLSNNLPVLIYNGQDDLIVTNPGTMSWVEKLTYATVSENEFNKDFDVWKDKSGSQIYGYKKSDKNNRLDLRIVLKAGHMVPQDQPEAALDMITDFVENKCK